MQEAEDEGMVRYSQLHIQPAVPTQDCFKACFPQAHRMVSKAFSNETTMLVTSNKFLQAYAASVSREGVLYLNLVP